MVKKEEEEEMIEEMIKEIIKNKMDILIINNKKIKMIEEMIKNNKRMIILFYKERITHQKYNNKLKK